MSWTTLAAAEGPVGSSERLERRRRALRPASLRRVGSSAGVPPMPPPSASMGPWAGTRPAPTAAGTAMGRSQAPVPDRNAARSRAHPCLAWTRRPPPRRASPPLPTSRTRGRSPSPPAGGGEHPKGRPSCGGAGVASYPGQASRREGEIPHVIDDRAAGAVPDARSPAGDDARGRGARKRLVFHLARADWQRDIRHAGHRPSSARDGTHLLPGAT